MQCVFLGNFSDNGKYFKLLNLQTLKNIHLRRAIFEEEFFYKHLPNAQVDSIAFDMPDESTPDIIQPNRQAGSNRYHM